ncbi:MAG: hypothetical protein KDK48_02170, partial [Chlamydiia bacterium]|nr:hypothetical protein [Chlamydiia bacterium]
RELKETTLNEPLDIVWSLMKHFKNVEIKIESGPGKDKFTPRELKDEKLQQQLIITSYDLLKANDLNTKDVEKLMGLVTGSRHKIRALQKISAIMALGRVDLLKECGKLDEALETAFADTVGVQGNDDFFNKFWNKFGEFRDPQALFIYAGQLNKLPEPDRSLVLQDLRSYIQSVITDKFHENRSTDLDPHWVEGVQKQVSIMTSGSTLNFAKLLRTSFADKHISEEVIQNVTPYLDNPNKELDGELKSYEKELILLAREGAKHLGPLLRALEGYQGEEQEIKTDVNGWISAKMPSKGGLRTYKLVDGDDPCDFLLMGTEVSGSCQRVDGDQANNKGLAGTMLDGHNRLLLLKDPSGKIVGRSLLRLVKESDKSALLLERIYPVTLGSAEKEALLDFAKERSKALGWSLYGVKVEFDGAETAATLTSVGGTGAYQYVDSAGGNQPQGAFVLESSRLHLLS